MSVREVVVIGGGVVGASAAHALASAGVRTLLVDASDPGQATAAGAGIIAPGTSLRPLPAFYPFAARAVRAYPPLLESLAADGETNTGYEIVGKLFVAMTEGERPRLHEALALFRQRRDEGMPNLGAMELVSSERARELFPPLAHVAEAILIPDAARVEGALLREALTAAARKRGATIRRGRARPVIERAAVAGVRIDDEDVPCDRVVLAAGAWSPDVVADLNLTLPVEPQRGQIAHLQIENEDTGRWPIVGGFGDQYILTFRPDRVVAGATRETGSGFDVRQTAGGVQAVLNEALRVAPGLATATLREVRIGLRPLATDGLPFLGPAPGVGGVIVATGHGPSGLQLGPYSGMIAATLAQDQTVDVDLTPFAVERAA
ncbi:MAG: FAD-dependent oxidoreductase [Chloroflexota bacterium]|nr:FAD-dependent oxidoreductase [Chloroflexota bacterium]